MKNPNPSELNSVERAQRVLLLSLFGAFFFFVAVWIGEQFFPPYYAFIPGGVLVLLAILLHNLRNHDATCAAAAFCNAAACGFAVSVYFTAMGIALPPLVICAVLIALLLLLLLTFFLSLVRLSGNFFVALVMMLYLGGLVTLIGLWVTQPIEDPIYALSALSFIFYTFSLIPMMLMRDGDDTGTDRTVSFWSFSVAILILLAVLLAISIASGDGCDGDCCDCSDCRSEKSKKKKP